MMAASRLEGTMAAVGIGGRKNEIAYSLLQSEAPSRNVVFFGGDSVESQGHEVIDRLSKPENIISVLLQKFKASNIWVISPSRYEGPWACYDNFLPKTTMSGEPIGYDARTPFACSHLHALLRDTLLKTMPTPAPPPGSTPTTSAPSPDERSKASNNNSNRSEGDEEDTEWDVFMQSPFFGWSWFQKDPSALMQPLLVDDESSRRAREDDGSVEIEVGDGGSREERADGEARGEGDLEAGGGGVASVSNGVGESSGSDVLQGGRATNAPGTVLVGFSKGGVVLNQILTEMAALEERLSSASGATTGSGGPSLAGASDGQSALEPSQVLAFTRTVEEVHFVDVGLNCRGAYITDPHVLNWLAKTAIAQPHGLLLALHGSPRQWADRNRRWIAQEKDRCLMLLRNAIGELGDPEARKSLRIVERSYFPGEKASLSMHFKVIDAMIVDPV